MDRELDKKFILYFQNRSRCKITAAANLEPCFIDLELYNYIFGLFTPEEFIFPTYNLTSPVQVVFKPSQFLLSNRPNITRLRLVNADKTKLSTLMQHFHIVSDSYPAVKDNDDVFSDLKNVFNAKFEVEPTIHPGLELLWYIDENDVNSSDTLLQPFPGSENVTSLRFHDLGSYDLYPSKLTSAQNRTLPRFLKTYLWPELTYLELDLTDFTASDISTLKEIVPKLHYLKLCIVSHRVPDIVWTFDWNSLPWRTGFVVRYETTLNVPNNLKLDMKGKIRSGQIPPVHFYYGMNEMYDPPDIHHFISDTNTFFDPGLVSKKPLTLHVDFSNNGLNSLGFLQITTVNINIYANFSNNGLRNVNLTDRFHLIRSGWDNIQTSRMRLLDLSYNQFNDSFNLGIEDPLFSHLHELYLHHNSLTRLPLFSIFPFPLSTITLRDLKQLRILDMSHNFITKIASYDLPSDEYSSLVRIDFSHNSLRTLADIVYTGKYLTNVDFSYNRINFSSIWPHNITVTPLDRTRTSVYLSGNDITHLDISQLDQTQINNLHNILENFDLHLDGNPIQCSCETHRMFKYLISYSQSERPDANIDDLPNFSFYKSHWKCIYPSEWAGIPLMQILEYEYDQRCVESLPNCSGECFCYHSWNFNKATVAYCSHNSKHVHVELPQTLPESTSHLHFADNKLASLCQEYSYLHNLKVLDLGWNDIHTICVGIFGNLNQVVELNLSNNHLKKLPDDIDQMVNLTKLLLANNVLTELPTSILNMQNLEKIDITGNTLRCDCDTFWMTDWLVNSFTKVENPYSIVCVSGQGQGKHMIELKENDVGCHNESSVMQYALIGVASVFALTMILATVIYRYKGYIKIWLYTRFGFHPWDKVKENLQEKDYDAFVSFCRKDVDWVLKTLLPYLEAPQCGFHLCVHDRDFVPGVTITKNIMTAIKCSRRTILVLTPDFIKSGWCDLEFQAAHKRALDDRSNFLIAVVLKEVNEKDLDETLKLYMKTNTYVAADDKWFWQKMLYAMPKVPIDKLKAQKNNQNDNNLPLDNHPFGNQAHYNAAVMINEHDNINNPRLDDHGDHHDNNDDAIDMSDSDAEVEVRRDAVYRRPCTRNMVARLPPLFRRINTYYGIMKNNENLV